jgi:DNA-binding NarL/FixJ family response regulator
VSELARDPPRSAGPGPLREGTAQSGRPRERITGPSAPRERITGPARPHAASAQLAAVAGPAPLRRAIVGPLREEGLAVTVADDLDALDELTRERPPSLVIPTVDTPLSSRSGTLAYARRRAREAQIVLVCSAIQGWEVRDALAAGVTGIVLRANVADALVPCLRAVRAGQVCVPYRNRNQVERPVLSAREKQILGLVVMGYMNRQIADRLFLAESTVKSHLSSAFGKLEVHSRNEAVDVILDPQRGLDLGILALGGEPVRPGGEPVRPGAEPVRPGAEPVRPGGEPVRRRADADA